VISYSIFIWSGWNVQGQLHECPKKSLFLLFPSFVGPLTRPSKEFFISSSTFGAVGESVVPSSHR
jgi:hypothetical protein